MSIMREITKMKREMDWGFGKEIMDRSTLANGIIIRNKGMDLTMMEKDRTMKELGKTI